MSIRLLLRSSRTLYTCLCVPRKETGMNLCARRSPIYQPVSHVSDMMSTSLSNDQSQSQLVEDEEQREEQIVKKLEELDLNESKKLFPTFETHKMLIDGVRYDELPIVHVKAVRNNTIVTVTRGKEDVIHASCGTVGFRNRRKGTTIAAQAVALDIAQKSLDNDIKTVRVVLKGIGPGRLPFLRSLQLMGINIVSITDATHIPFNGNRPKNKRVR